TPIGPASRENSIYSRLVREAPRAGEDHGQGRRVGRIDDFLVAEGAARLKNWGGTRANGWLQPVGKGKKATGRDDSARRRPCAPSLSSLPGGDAAGIDTAHLTCSNPNRATVPGVNNGV